MIILIDKITNKITRTIDKDYGIQVTENELLQEITDETLINKINSAYEYTLIQDSNGYVTDITITKTMEQYQQEQSVLPQTPSIEDRVSAIETALLSL